MYAIIEQGGKQYKVSQGDVINIELTEVAADAKTIELDKVLFVSDGKKVQVGTPYLDGAKVVASFKVSIGHRQKYLQVIVDSIEA
jgi:large subunit ribosomal protein L21